MQGEGRGSDHIATEAVKKSSIRGRLREGLPGRVPRRFGHSRWRVRTSRNWGQQISSLGSQPALPARYAADQSEMTRVFDRGRIKYMGPTFRSTQKTLLQACHPQK